MTITLYGVTRSRASRVVWLCLEAGIPFAQVPVIQARFLADPAAPDAPFNTSSPEFLRINPNGLIPSLKDGDLVLHESLAINLYLARKIGPPLGPRDAADDGLLTMWTLWAATEAEPHGVEIVYNRVIRSEAECDWPRVKAAVAALQPKLAVLDRHLASRDWLVGERFTVADINLAEVLRYAASTPELFEAAPHVRRWLEACHARPAFQEMMRRREAETA